MAGVQDRPDHAEVWVGQAILQKPRECLSLPFSFLPFLSLHPFLRIDHDVGQPNEYDLNDSFLDDEEEEYEPTDEDSDWEPEKEDQEKEDTEELLKEAKKFMKRKK